jgi:hypothetical protein
MATSVVLLACEKSAEEQARDPANCEQMKNIPEAYERCKADLK